VANLLRTSNPALSGGAFRGAGVAYGAEAMTVTGTVNKTGILTLCVIASAAWTWSRFFNGESVMGLVAIGARARWMAWSKRPGTQDRTAWTLGTGSAIRLRPKNPCCRRCRSA